MKDIDAPGCIILAFLVGTILFLPTFFIGSSYMESKTFNRLTGANTTWFDALWVELRVQEAPR
jgi:hypothetical protein